MTSLDSGDNRPPCYYEDDGTLIIRASAIGSSCLWELVAAGQEYEPNPLPPNMRRAFGEGHALEPVVLKKLVNEYGVVVESTQEEGHLELTGGVKVRFHPDFLGTYSPDSSHEKFVGEMFRKYKIVGEIKALSNDLWWRAVKHGVESTIGEYKWQGSAMMLATGLPLLWIAYNKGFPPDENGVKPECPDQGKIHLQLVHTPFITLSEIALKALEVKELVDGEDILETGRACDDTSHWPCRYLHLRPEVGTETGVRGSTSMGRPADQGTPSNSTRKHLLIGAEDQDQVNDLVRNYIYHKGQADEHKQRQDQARDEIIALLGGDTGKVETDKWVVPVVKGSGAKTIAWDEMTEDDKAKLQGYLRAGKPYKYLRGIKRKDGKDASQ